MAAASLALGEIGAEKTKISGNTTKRKRNGVNKANGGENSAAAMAAKTA